MAHFLFTVVHIAAIFFGFVGLIVTIPLHLIYCAIKKERMTNITKAGWIFLFVIVCCMIKTEMS